MPLNRYDWTVARRAWQTKLDGKVKLKGYIFEQNRADHLIVLLHGWTESPRSFSQLIPRIQSALPSADLFVPKMPLACASITDLELLAKILVELISNYTHLKCVSNIEYRKITIAGHSCGGILARQLYLTAMGVEVAPGRVVVPIRPVANWVTTIDRIVLLAAVNRGWTISSAMAPLLRFVSPILIAFGHMLDLIPGRTPVIFQIRRGSTYLTNLRLKWMALERAIQKQVPSMVQLLGTIDDIVAPEDNIDVVTGARFIYLEVPHSGHFNVLKTDDAAHGDVRAKLICAALTESVRNLESRPEWRPVRGLNLPSELTANVMSNHDTPFRDGVRLLVCFIIHGIRDNGHWTRKIGERILTLSDRLGKRCFIYTPSYGYFPLLNFSLPWTRREKVEWFLDLYVDALGRHPGSEMVFIGHSNGTYLLAKALELCPAVAFDRVLFAGSVVRRNYDWPSRARQAKRVVNLVATGDWVVALFPRAFEMVRLQDLGSAGHDGFRKLSADANRSHVPGNHNAGIREEMWKDVAAFAVDGNEPMQGGKTIDGQLELAKGRSWFVILLGVLSPLSWIVLALATFSGAFWLLFRLPYGYAGWPAWAIAVIFALYVAFVKRVLTKF